MPPPPVGTIICTTSDVSPSSWLGGTWERYGEGRVLVSRSNDRPAGSTGGQSSVRLNSDLASVYGLAVISTNDLEGDGLSWTGLSTGDTPIGKARGYFYKTTNETMESAKGMDGSWGSHQVQIRRSYTDIPTMPPYVSVYMFRRVA